MLDIREYKTIIFDCDGVILDSNKVKTQAFYDSVLKYGQESAQQLVDYHVSHGGISRYIKFDWFFREVLGMQDYKSELDEVLEVYAQKVHSGLIQCRVTPQLDTLRQQVDSSWMIASGGDQEELRELFSTRKLSEYFTSGIFGSPDKKENIVKRELKRLDTSSPVLFVGDSRYDFEVAEANDLDFVFVKAWSEFPDWADYFSSKKNVFICERVSDLISHG